MILRQISKHTQKWIFQLRQFLGMQKLENHLSKSQFFKKLWILFFFCAFVCAERWCHHQTVGFSISKILTSSPENFSSPVEVCQEDRIQASGLLTQPFYFYAKGGQCFIFIGADGETILKFFKQHHIRFWKALSRVSFPFFLENWRLKLLEKHRYQTQPYLFQSCKTAYEKFKEHTGLIYVQFANHPLISQQATLHDPLKIVHRIELTNTDFILQKKAAPFHKILKKRIREHRLDLSKDLIDKMLDLIIARCHEGVADRDCNFRTNFGVLKNQVIEIDIGSYHDDLCLKAFDSSKIELLKQTAKFKKWLERHHPGLAHYLSEKIEALYPSTVSS